MEQQHSECERLSIANVVGGAGPRPKFRPRVISVRAGLDMNSVGPRHTWLPRLRLPSAPAKGVVSGQRPIKSFGLSFRTYVLTCARTCFKSVQWFPFYLGCNQGPACLHRKAERWGQT